MFNKSFKIEQVKRTFVFLRIDV